MLLSILEEVIFSNFYFARQAFNVNVANIAKYVLFVKTWSEKHLPFLDSKLLLLGEALMPMLSTLSTDEKQCQK